MSGSGVLIFCLFRFFLVEDEMPHQGSTRHLASSRSQSTDTIRSPYTIEQHHQQQEQSELSTCCVKCICRCCIWLIAKAIVAGVVLVVIYAT